MDKKVFVATYPDGTQKVFGKETDVRQQDFVTGKWVPLTDQWDGRSDRRERKTEESG